VFVDGDPIFKFEAPDSVALCGCLLPCDAMNIYAFKYGYASHTGRQGDTLRRSGKRTLTMLGDAVLFLVAEYGLIVL